MRARTLLLVPLSVFIFVTMSELILPSRICLTCVQSGRSCDGKYPACSRCHRSKAACRKPNLEIELPWEKDLSKTTLLRNASQQVVLVTTPLFSKEYIEDRHSPLITSLTRLYDTLLLMQYIDEDEILRPPHSHIPINELSNTGMEMEATELLRYLPHLTTTDEISPATSPFNNLRSPGEARDVRYQGENDIAPWTIRLTRASHYGRVLVYDIHTKNIASWVQGVNGYYNSYIGFPTSPADQVLNEWTENLRALHELPWGKGSGNRMVDTEPPGYPYGWNQWIDLIGTGFAWEKVNSYSTQSAKNHRNTYLSKKKLYVDYGWPDNFDSEGFRAARDRWQAEIDRYWREDELRRRGSRWGSKWTADDGKRRLFCIYEGKCRNRCYSIRGPR